MAGEARRGAAWQGEARRGSARRGKAGEARQGWAGLGKAWRGAAWQGKARPGAARQGKAWHGMAGEARHGMAWRGAARQGMAGGARHGWARRGKAWRAWVLFVTKEFNMRVAYRRGYQCGVDPEVAYREIERIRAAKGGDCVAADIVKAARPKSSKLHDVFCWDDKQAATEYRLHQARNLLNAIRVVREEPGMKGKTVRAYATRTIKEEQQPARRVYSNMEDILGDPDARAELLARVLRQLVNLQREFRAIQEFAVVWRAIDDVATTIDP